MRKVEMKIEAGTELARSCLDIALKAGDAILEIYGEDFSVSSKSDASPLTEADLASHNIIVKALEQLAPGVPVLSEESVSIPWRVRRDWTTYFLVDPLDGTKEFVKRNGEFTVNIALIDHHRPVLGVVHVPVHEQSYYGGQSFGCWNVCNGKHNPIATHAPMQRTPVVVGSRSHANPELTSRLQALGEHEMVSMGSSLKFCRVASGEADFYPRLGPTSEWDTAAAQAVVEGAGGRVVTMDGESLAYNTKEDILNPEFLVYGDSSFDWVAMMNR